MENSTSSHSLRDFSLRLQEHQSRRARFSSSRGEPKSGRPLQKQAGNALGLRCPIPSGVQQRSTNVRQLRSRWVGCSSSVSQVARHHWWPPLGARDRRFGLVGQQSTHGQLVGFCPRLSHGGTGHTCRELPWTVSVSTRLARLALARTWRDIGRDRLRPERLLKYRRGSPRHVSQDTSLCRRVTIP